MTFRQNHGPAVAAAKAAISTATAYRFEGAHCCSAQLGVVTFRSWRGFLPGLRIERDLRALLRRSRWFRSTLRLGDICTMGRLHPLRHEQHRFGTVEPTTADASERYGQLGGRFRQRLPAIDQLAVGLFQQSFGEGEDRKLILLRVRRRALEGFGRARDVLPAALAHDSHDFTPDTGTPAMAQTILTAPIAAFISRPWQAGPAVVSVALVSLIGVIPLHLRGQRRRAAASVRRQPHCPGRRPGAVPSGAQRHHLPARLALVRPGEHLGRHPVRRRQQGCVGQVRAVPPLCPVTPGAMIQSYTPTRCSAMNISVTDERKGNRSSALIYPVQCRMARVAVGWGVRELAAASGLAMDTVVRFEQGATLRPRTVEAIRNALEDAGIVFIGENGGGPGVRMRPATRESA